jgi:hypothetical protein
MKRLRNCLRSDRGAMSVEAVIILPILIWALFGMFTVFEAFRQRSVTLKASYTVADMISRQVDALTPAAIGGLNDVFDYLTISHEPSWIRVTSVYWDKDESVFRAHWSFATHGHVPLNNLTLQDFREYVPAMSTGDTVILLETYLTYTPVFDMGLTGGVSRNVIVTRPRFASQVVFDLNA